MNDHSSMPAAAEATAQATGEAHPEPGDETSPAGTVAIGQLVITWDDDKPRAYGGPSDHPGFTEVSFGLFDGRTPVIKCDPQRVAPADTPIPARDARVAVEQRPRSERPYGAAGNWRLTLPGQLPTWHKTKRDGTVAGLRRVAILDWHARQAAAGPPHEFRPRDFTAPDYNYLTSEQRTILAWLADHPLSTGPDIQAGTGLHEAVCAEYVTYLAWDGILAADEQGRFRILGEDEEPPMILVELDADQAAAVHEVINENLARQANLGHPPQEA